MSFLHFEKILVGVSLGHVEDGSLAEHEQILLRVTLGLAQRLGAAVKLTHVVESSHHHWLEYLNSDPGIPSPSINLLQEEAKEVFENRMSGLSKLKAFLPDNLEIESSVVNAADVSSGLVAEALSNNCDMICLGIRGSIPQLFPSGLSTVLNLMTESPLPVLICGSGMHADFSRTPIKVLLTDDMRIESSFAVAHAAGFALQLKHGELHHAHVLPTNLPSVFRAFMPEVQSYVRKKMPARVHFDKEIWADRDFSYMPHELSGSVADEIDQLVLKLSPDVILFGQHHKIHRRPISLGKLALRAMIHYGRPVVVFPDSLILRKASNQV